ncbi:MAG: hypothetical protein K0R38_6086 [Polyangiaceae bacterium]|jgi:hypothetical protein|nr:hypothetical protein [Polyangiaceae bacterium]
MRVDLRLLLLLLMMGIGAACTRLTAVDWSLIQDEQPGAGGEAASGGSASGEGGSGAGAAGDSG